MSIFWKNNISVDRHFYIFSDLFATELLNLRIEKKLHEIKCNDISTVSF